MTDTPTARILVAEDDRAVRESLVRALQLEGYTVAAAHNGAEALEAIRQGEPEVLLLDVSMPIVEIVKVFALILIPVVIGMLVRRWRPGFAAAMDKPVRIGSAIILAVLVVGILVDQAENVTDYLASIGLAAAIFCAASLIIGYVVPRALGVIDAQAIASSMEIGVHNSTLAIFVAVEVLDEIEISIPAAVYSLFMFVMAAAWGRFISRRVARTDERSLSDR